MASTEDEVIDFSALEKELCATVESEQKYRRENEAKVQAVSQKVASYQEFRDLVLSCHLKPVDKKERGGAPQKQPWNPLVARCRTDRRRERGKAPSGFIIFMWIFLSAASVSLLVMKEQNLKEKVTKILQEAPNARRALLENYDNLLNVADYCCNSYLQSGEGSITALEETKNFATQSLASVAYQVSMLANSVLSLLDAQTNQLRHMESSINHIGQTVEMHKEKVSRREIGIFTAARRVPHSHKIFPPPLAGTQPRPPYSRRPINYQQLDSLGHGIKVSGKQNERLGTRRKHGGSIRTTKPSEPVQCPVVPPVSSSSFGKPVAPPTAPTVWPECDVITTLLEDAPPPLLVHDDHVILAPPPPPSPPHDTSVETVVPPQPTLTNHSTTPMALPLLLETVVEENRFPTPSTPPPPPPDDNAFPPPANECQELPPPPPPPSNSQEVEVTLQSRRSHRRSPPSSCSLSLRVSSGPASSSRYTRSLFLPAIQSLMIPPPPPYPPPLAPLLCSSSSSPRVCLPACLEHLDLEVPAPPPPLLLDDEGAFDDIMTSLPPPMDDNTDAPPQYTEKVVALYSYEASKPDELSFTRGDVVYLLHRHVDGWWEGVVNGNRGFFPQNYVQSGT
ncbi:hypothetical protein LDENG_00220140 [Lucifuga dentata]|nr:hypothetical protein LDENG_00220140 [Lucifuga dentata]